MFVFDGFGDDESLFDFGSQSTTVLTPIAVNNGPYTVNEGSQINLDGTLSSEVGGSISKYEWDYNYNGTTFNVSATGTSPVFSAAAIDGPATRVIALRVTDAAGNTAIATATLTVLNVAPTAVFSGSTVTLGAGGTVQFTGASDPSSVDTAAGFTYSYDFNDDGVYDLVTTAPTAAVPASYLTTAGAHSIGGKINDKDGGFTTYTATVEVNTEATKLMIATQATAGIAGVALSPVVTVKVLSATGGVVTTDTSSITLAIASGPTGGTLTGSSTARVVNGVATFSGLALKVAGVYTFKVTDGSLTSATSTFITISPAAASKVVITQQPSAGAAGVTLSPNLTVGVEDAFGNLVTSNSSTITLALSTFPGGATLTGTAVAKAVKGIATFTGLSLKTAGAYTFKVTDGSLTSATSSSITISPAAASRLVVTEQPSTGTAGVTFSPSLVVSVEDAFGNVVTSNTSTLTVVLSSFPGGATLTGTTTAKAVKGVAVFTGLSLKTAGVYTLKFTDGSLTATISSSIAISAAAAAKLVFSQQPTIGTHGDALSPVIIVEVEDALGNVVTTDTSSVTLAIGSGPSGGVVSGTVTVKAIKGIVTFGKLTLSKAGTYTFKATDGKLISATSKSIVLK